MTGAIAALVLFAALLHALWNALVKGAADRSVMLGLIALGHVIPGIALTLVTPAPAAASIPFIIASTVIHWGYYLFLNISYRFGELSLAYPVARGLAPVLIALGAWIWADEILPPLAWVGILCVSVGILILALRRAVHAGGLGAALVTSALIAAYSIVDGIGIRLSGSPIGYIGWLFAAEICVAAFVGLTHLARLRATNSRALWLGFLGGLLSSLAYALVLYAKLVTPLGLVSALRETSVIFAALIGVFWMGEGPAARRIFAALVVACGIIILSLS